MRTEEEMNKKFSHGNSQVSSTTRINIWQGRFPYKNTALDGYKTTSPENLS